MKIAVLVKYVPEPSAEWRYADDLTLDRAGIDGRLSELDEYAVEQAVRLADAGTATEVVYVTLGPAKAVDALRKALAMGGHRGVHVVDDAMHGSCAVATSLVLAKALERVGADLVLTGMASTDAEMSVVPAMVAERLGLPQATFAGSITVDGTTVRITRDTDTEVLEVEAPLPAMVSVTDQAGEARYPSFKGIMAGKKKPVETISLADLGIAAGDVGATAATTVMVDAAPRPPRQAGEVVTDDGSAAAAIRDFLVGAKLA